MRNEKGSVLSIAIVIIFILSFSVTLTTAYTFNVSQRTSTIVENNDEDLFARTIVRSVVQELKEFIYSYKLLPQDYIQFGLDDQTNRDKITLKYNEPKLGLIAIYYLSKNIELSEDALKIVIAETGDFVIGTESYTRKYSVEFTKQNKQVVYKELLIQLKSEGDFEDTMIIPVITDLKDLFDYLNLKNSSLLTDEEELDCKESIESCPQAFIDAFYKKNGLFGTLTGDVLINGNFSLDFLKGGSSVQLNLATPDGEDKKAPPTGNIMVVNGNLTLTNLPIIEGPGLIVVLGDLELKSDKRLYFKNFIILVSGKTTIDNSEAGSGQRTLNGENYHIVSADVTDGLPDDLSGEFFNYTYSDLITGPFYRYVGSHNPFPGFDFIMDELDQYIDIGEVAGFTNIFDFIESSFQEKNSTN